MLLDSGLDLFGCSEIWQAPWQHCCQDACQISERYDHYNIQSRGFEDFTRFGGKTSYRLVNRGPDLCFTFVTSVLYVFWGPWFKETQL